MKKYDAPGPGLRIIAGNDFVIVVTSVDIQNESGAFKYFQTAEDADKYFAPKEIESK